MTYEETRKVLSVIRASFPSYFAKFTSEEGENFLAVWSDMFAEDDPMLVMSAVKSYIRSNTGAFPPSVGQVVELMHKLTHPVTITEQEAWNMVYRACCNSIYHAQEEFDKLPEEVKSVVGSHNQLKQWAVMDNNELGTVVASNFMRSYKARVASNKEFAKLPDSVHDMISTLTDAKRLNNK